MLRRLQKCARPSYIIRVILIIMFVISPMNKEVTVEEDWTRGPMAHPSNQTLGATGHDG